MHFYLTWKVTGEDKQGTFLSCVHLYPLKSKEHIFIVNKRLDKMESTLLI